MLKFGVRFNFKKGFSIQGSLPGDEGTLAIGQDFYFSHMPNRRVKFIYIGNENGSACFEQMDDQVFFQRELLRHARENDWESCTVSTNLDP